MRFHSKRTVAVAAALTLALGGGVAYAYWSTSGSGTGSAATAVSGTLVTVTQTGPAVTGLYPGGPAQTFGLDVTNPAAYDQSINAVAVTVTSTSGGGACLPANFLVTSPTVVPATVIGAGATLSLTGASVALDETGVNQDGCKNVLVNLAFTVS